MSVRVWMKSRAPLLMEPVVTVPMIRRAIDGVLVPEGTKEAYPLAVVIENSVDAWPISGIAAANLVWEAPAEAGIPRLLAIFADGSEIVKIGPVRSARPYFVDWTEEFQALFAHVGGSPEALNLIPSRAIFDLNEFFRGNYFWRASDRPRPHNVYTSTELLTRAIKDSSGQFAPARRVSGATKPERSGGVLGAGRGGRIVHYDAWLYKDDVVRGKRSEPHDIVIDFGKPLYEIRWTYDPERNAYLRFQNDTPYLDASGQQVVAKNVVVIATDIAILDEVGRRRIKTVGTGNMEAFVDGGLINGRWKRPDRKARTRFYGENDFEVRLNAGSTWIEVVRDIDQVEIIPMLPPREPR